MALTRKMLSAMEIDATKVDEIIAAHVETVDALKEERDKFKADAERLPAVQTELTDLQAKMQSGNNNSWQVKYDAMKEERDSAVNELNQFKADIQAKDALAQKEIAYRKALVSAGISEKRIDSVMRVSTDAINSIEFDESGNVSNNDALMDSIKSEWADFVVTEGTQGAKTPNPPANNTAKTFTADDIKKMSPEDINNNWDAIKASLKQ